MCSSPEPPSIYLIVRVSRVIQDHLLINYSYTSELLECNLCRLSISGLCKTKLALGLTKGKINQNINYFPV